MSSREYMGQISMINCVKEIQSRQSCYQLQPRSRFNGVYKNIRLVLRDLGTFDEEYGHPDYKAEGKPPPSTYRQMNEQ
jgi:hypothetical protein